MIVAATGHRPEKLGGYSTQTRLALGGLAVEYLSAKQPDRVIVGMAQGWDQAVGAAALALDIPFIAAVPFPGQARRWTQEAQARWKWLLDAAEQAVFVSETDDIGVMKAYQDRNEWMVDHADRIVALWDGSWGGTHNCLRYAERKGVEVDNLWARWTLDEDVRDLLG